jgi:hypothetical protein
MVRKLSYILGIVFLLSSVPMTGFSQDKPATEEHHTGVKRTYHKAKRKVRRAWKKTKSTTTNTYNKAKDRIQNGDAKQDAQERK